MRAPSGDGAGAATFRRRLAVWVFALLLVDAVFLAWVYFQARPPAASLRVARFEPSGEVPTDAEISITFTADAVRMPDAGGTVAVPRPVPLPTGTGLVRISPEVPGEAFWVGPGELVFRPRTRFAGATSYQVELSERIGEEVGLELEGDRTFQFFTVPLKFLGAVQAGFTRDLEATIRLRFNDRVDPDDLRRHLELLDGASNSIPYQVVTDDAQDHVDVSTLRGVNELRVALRAGLTGASGPLGLERDHHVNVALSRRLRLLQVDAGQVFLESPSIRLRFNHRVAMDPDDTKKLEDYFLVDPPVRFTATQRWGNSVILSGDFEPHERYRVTARTGLRGEQDTVLAADTSRGVTIPDRKSGVVFREKGGFLSPGGNRRVVVRSANLEAVGLAAHRVLPGNLVHYLAIGRHGYRDLFVRRGEWHEFVIESPVNEVVETAISMDDLVAEDVAGVWCVDVRRGGSSQFYPEDRLVVAMTDLALSVKKSADGMLFWVTSLSGGTPVPRARVQIWSTNGQEIGQGRTDANGLLKLAGPFPDADGAPVVATADLRGDLTYLELSKGVLSRAEFDVRGHPFLDRGYEAFLFTDRGVYRPGETVHVEGIVRDAALEAPEPFPVEVEVLRPDRKRFRLLTGKLSATGSVVFDVPVPDTARTGLYRVSLGLPGDESTENFGATTFLVEDFLPLRMRAKLAVGADDDASEEGRRYRRGEEIEVSVRGEYLAGMAAAGARAGVEWALASGTFRHDDWKGYTFGDESLPAPRMHGYLDEEVLDANGAARFRCTVPESRSNGLPLRLSIEATVSEVSGRPARARETIDVDPHPYYIGLRPEFAGNASLERPAEFRCAAVHPDGSVAPLDALELTVHHLVWTSVLRRDADRDYRYDSHLEEKEVESTTVKLDGGRGDFSLRFPTHGRFRVRLRDPESGAVTAYTTWVSGPGWWASAPSLSRPEYLELSVAPRTYRPGDSVQVNVRAPFAGTLLLTLESDRVLEARVLELEKNEGEVSLPIPEHSAGNIYIAATAVRAVDASQETWLPHRAYGLTPLWLRRSPEELVVTVEAAGEVRPRSEAATRVSVAREDGSPCGAEVTLVVVDEGILARTAHATPDPWSFFYGQRAHAVTQVDLYSQLLREVPLSVRTARPGGDGPGDGLDSLSRRLSPVRARRVKNLALWLGRFHTDGEGQVVTSFPLPAFTGELRVMAVAHAGRLFGCGDAFVKVRSPLHLEIGMPRFLAPGDTFVSEVGVFNTTKTDGRVALEWRLDGPIEPYGPGVDDLAFASLPARAIDVAAGASGQVGFELHAAENTGVAKATLTARLDAASQTGELGPGDAIDPKVETTEEEIELPVRPAVPFVTRTSAGRVMAGVPFELELEDEFLAGTARHHLSLSPLPAIELVGALRKVLKYPHGCLEQTTSRAFPLVYLRDIVDLLKEGYGEDAVNADLGGAEEDVDGFVYAGIERLLSMQCPGGWLASWPGSRARWVWGSVYAAHFLVEAKEAGYDVPDRELGELLGYLEKDIVQQPAEDVSRLERAYALFVLALAERDGLDGFITSLLRDASSPVTAAPTSRNRAPSSIERDEGLSSEGRFLLGAALIRLGETERAREALGSDLPPATAHRDLGGALRSPAREAAILLSVVIDADPSSPRVPALVERLRGYRVDGTWQTTQENAFALLALGKYAKMARSEPANYTARVEVGEEVVTLTATDSRVVQGDFSGETVRIVLEGQGNLYWFLQTDGVPRDGKVLEEDSGLTVRRRYLDRHGEEITTGMIERGEVVQVEIVLESSRSLQNVVVSDLLPAGLEVENPRLGAGGLARDSLLDAQYVDVRDDRVLVFADLPRHGKAVYRYAARAVTRGDFALPAISAECMYAPGIFSRHGGGRLRVE